MSTISPPAPYTPPPAVPYTPPHVVDDDGDYEYYWSRGGVDIRIPRWIAEIIDVPLMVRLEIFLVGVCMGLIIAALALIIGFYTALG